MWKYQISNKMHLLKDSVEIRIYNYFLTMGGASWSNEIIQHIGNGKNPYLNRMVERGIIKRIQAYASKVPGLRGVPVIVRIPPTQLSDIEYSRLVSAMRRVRSNTTRTYWIIAGD